MISLIDGDFQILVYEIRNNKIEFNNSKFGIFLAIITQIKMNY